MGKRKSGKDKEEKDQIEEKQPDMDQPEAQDDAPEEEGPKAKVSKGDYEALKAKARQEVLEEIQRGQLTVPKKVFKKGAKSALEPVFAATDAVRQGKLSAQEQELPASENELVEVDVDEFIYVNGKQLFGKVICKVHEARGIIHMVQEKKRANLESTIGRNFLAKKLASGKLEVKEVQDLDKEIK